MPYVVFRLLRYQGCKQYHVLRYTVYMTIAAVGHRRGRYGAMSLTNWKTQLRKGLLELCLLNLLTRGECYGYDLVQSLKRLEVLRIREGTVYPILARLAEEGLIVSESRPSQAGPARKYFRLTAPGRRHLAAINEHWDAVIAALKECRQPAG